MIARARHLAARLGLAAIALVGAGWDTKGYPTVNEELHWTSMYYAPTDGAAARLWSDSDIDPAQLESGNEHAELAHIALLQLGWHAMLYVEDMPEVLDLNASVWRPKVREAADELEPDDVSSTALIERRIPHPARWASVADMSYTIYDWLGRNTECPAVPASDPTSQDCHVYSEWLGAALNSSHFGEQATQMYLRLHAIALSIGQQAGEMRAALVRNDSDADAAPIEDMIREAELEALAYEGYAQHFLSDRWSSGHMWSRYGSPEYQGAASFSQVKAVGLYSGLIHGAEAAFSMLPSGFVQWVPDMMCSPQIDEEEEITIPASYVHADGSGGPMVGDYRLEDAIDGAFGKEYDYEDTPLDVHTQIEDMMICSRAGWADVARGFGPNPDGTFGVLALPVDGEAGFDAQVQNATQDDYTVACFDHWATNATMVLALNDPLKPTLFQLLETAASGAMTWQAGVAGALVSVDLAVFGKAYLALQHHGRVYPTRTDLADGSALPPAGAIGPGTSYLSQVPASYIEPAPVAGEDPFDSLPIHAAGWDMPSAGDRPGRDKHTLYGYFNQAHAGALCEASPEVLDYDPARAFDDPEQGLRWPVPVVESLAAPTTEEAAELARRQDACVLLADRLFSRTRAWYREEDLYMGSQRELRRVGHGGTSAANAAPACETLEAVPDGALGSAWEDNPYELHPGYVATGLPYETVPFYGDNVYRSLVSWCKALPVVHVDDNDVAVDDAGDPIAVHPGFRDDGSLSFDADVRAPEVTLHGLHFGVATGQVELVSESGCVTDPPISRFADIVSWSDTAITIRVPHTRFIPDHYAITIIRADRAPGGSRVRSVGRFRLDIQRAAFGDVADTDPPLATDVTGQLFAALSPFCYNGVVTSQRVHDCTGTDEIACGSDGGPGTLLWADGAPAGYQPGPYAEHQWTVLSTSICSAMPGWVTCMPQYFDSYGMIYRVERTSTAPVTATPKRWRWTLIWQRPGPFF